MDLDLRDRKALAFSLLREDKAADHALLAFYLLATGDAKRAEDHLVRCGDGAAAVRAAFQ